MIRSTSGEAFDLAEKGVEVPPQGEQGWDLVLS